MQDKVNWSSNRISKDPTNSKTMILNFRTYGFIDTAKAQSPTGFDATEYICQNR